ncbi:dienelactone hydrolase [Wenjunlia vitaminophila]|uniref:Dienelactone hydrolase n=1 Tax=Wenjunlia vitaminophila TaxID=76728 RepID=A0A0T6LLN6_WENVI|nr:alpha/beta hydrolase [Wenjunlia vitaminophila]KRV46920.1 dienelactone hydrolase [Wenjunlia vitaminophila]
MGSDTLPTRGARLGRPVGGAPAGTVRGAVLLLPGGEVMGTRRPTGLAAAALWPLGRYLARAGRKEGLVGHIVHYRHSGWNGDSAHPAQDAAWAVEEVVRRYGDVPVCLVGMAMGARAALRVAGHEAVVSVVALAPWLPVVPDPDPVRQLAGRKVLIAHGTRDAEADPELSYRFAQRVKKVNPDICRFEVHSDGHTLYQHRPEIFALTSDFLLGTLFAQRLSRPVADALAAPPPLGLRMPLASGFGRSLRP